VPERKLRRGFWTFKSSVLNNRAGLLLSDKSNPVICDACDGDWREKKALPDEYNVKVLEILDT
jgi:hypothetical protein